ncbi:MAG TPA: LPS export ABC transporter periplasmic protein LptC [Gammaproteobacteria bacterium]|nr:LPS export ABC transporter periplasmic protein LptC [Gammaproteobacteria bacterium]
MTWNRHWRMVATLAGLSLAALWLYLYTGRLDRQREDDSPQPDLTIIQPRLTTFNLQGQVRSQLYAERLEQWPHEDGARLTEPRLTLHDRMQRRWLATAHRGRTRSGDRSLLLEDRVVLKREPDHHGLVIKTGKLHIAQNGDTIETDDAVVLTSGSWHFTAMGLRTRLDRQRLELLNKVRGKHE